MNVTTWINLKYIMLKERKDSKSYLLYDSVILHSRKDKMIEIENRSVFSHSLEVKGGVDKQT